MTIRDLSFSDDRWRSVGVTGTILPSNSSSLSKKEIMVSSAKFRDSLLGVHIGSFEEWIDYSDHYNLLKKGGQL